jgi:DNA repair protein RadC
MFAGKSRHHDCPIESRKMRHFSITAGQVSDSAEAAARYIALCAALRNVIKHLSNATGCTWHAVALSGRMTMGNKVIALWPGALAPREKLLSYGAAALSDAELLAIFLRTGLPGLHVIKLAEQLLRQFGSLYHLMSADHQLFCSQKGLGNASYAQLQAISELAFRFFSGHLTEENAMLNPRITQHYLQSLLAHREREVFLVLFLDNQHRVIRHQEMFAGTISSVVVYPREIVRAALKANAAAVILAHNHPSGKAEPSHADRLITEQVVNACLLLEIRVLDHLVIGRGECVSFAERGWL